MNCVSGGMQSFDLDFPSDTSYVTGPQLGSYMIQYADHFNLRRFIRASAEGSWTTGIHTDGAAITMVIFLGSSSILPFWGLRHYLLVIYAIIAPDCFVCRFTPAYVCLFWVWFFLSTIMLQIFGVPIYGKNRVPHLLVQIAITSSPQRRNIRQMVPSFSSQGVITMDVNFWTFPSAVAVSNTVTSLQKSESYGKSAWLRENLDWWINIL